MRARIPRFSLFAQQVMLIGTYDPDGKERFWPISWVSYSWGPPPCLVVSIKEIQAMEFFDLRRINPVIYSPNHYFTVGEHLGRIGEYSRWDP